MPVTTDKKTYPIDGVEITDLDKPKVGDTRSTVTEGTNGQGAVQGHSHHSPNRDGHQQLSRTTGGQSISFISVEPDEQDTDPDHLEYENRMRLEDQAIRFILEYEPGWQQTPPNNPEFDSYRGPTLQKTTDWCEVKAMTRTFENRPVTISQT